jgi:hypothetical protein
MASMFASGSAWFCLSVGVVLLVEAAVFFVLRRRPGGGRRGPRGGQWPMLLSMGVMLISGSVARLGGLNGAGMTAAFLVGVASAVATIVFAIQSLDARRRTAPPSQEETR